MYVIYDDILRLHTSHQAGAVGIYQHECASDRGGGTTHHQRSLEESPPMGMLRRREDIRQHWSCSCLITSNMFLVLEWFGDSKYEDEAGHRSRAQRDSRYTTSVTDSPAIAVNCAVDLCIP